MKYACVAFLLILISSFSCNKSFVEEYAWVNATVIESKDINCGYPRLSFYEDSSKIRSITGETYFLEFVSKGLPQDLNIPGKKLRVQIINLKPEESFPCLTLGLNYPAIKILNATAQ